MTRFDCVLTDTYGGQPNYGWVRRETVTLPDQATNRSVIMAAKAALGLTGLRCRTSPVGEGWELRPSGTATVAFVTPSY